MPLRQAGLLTLLSSLALVGMTAEQAREAPADHRENHPRAVTLIGDSSWVISAQAIGVESDGRPGHYVVDETQARIALRRLARRIDSGRALDIEATLSELRVVARDGMGKPVSIAMREVQPALNAGGGETLATVTLPVPGTPRGRNMRAALAVLDSTVIRSESWLSIREALGPLAPSRGFVFAATDDQRVCLGAGAEACAHLLDRAAREVGLTVARVELPPALAAVTPMTRNLLIGNTSGTDVLVVCEASEDRGTLRIMGRRLPGARSQLSRRPASAPGGVSVALVGDVLPTGPVGDPGALGRLMRSTNLTLANLECPVSYRGRPLAVKLTPDEWAFRADPDTARRCLDEWGVGAVSLANNHALDYGPDALADTLRVLDDEDIGVAGAGADEASAWRPTLLDRRGLRIALLCCVGSDSLPTAEEFAAAADRPGLAVLTVDAEHLPDACDELAERVRALRWRADVVIVSLHSGREATGLPTDAQQRLARAAREAGADLVWGHHPHRLQPLEVAGEGDGLIAYSLGNFIFPPARDKQAHSGVLVVRWGGEGLLGAGFVPAIIEGRTPRPARDAALRQQIAGELLGARG